ncbi:hypothetical protein [Streptomyces griseoluteus]
MKPDNSAVGERGDDHAKGPNYWVSILTAVAGLVGALAALITALRG